MFGGPVTTGDQKPFKLPIDEILCTFSYSYRVDWMLSYQGMVVLAGNQVWWTWEAEDVFQKVKKGDKMGMKNYAKKMHKQIDELVVKVRNTSVFLCIG